MFGELKPVDGGAPILLEKPSVTIGKDRSCDVVIEHPSVSANHCHMEFRAGHWFIEDLGSRDGIGVNGEKVESSWVPELSVINIGTLEFDLQYAAVTATKKDNGAVSPELLSKLNHVMASIQPQKSRRIQIRVDQPLPPEVSKPCLGVLKAIESGVQIPLLYEELYLGRDAEADIVLPYLAIAKTHCVLRFREGSWLVRDLNENGITIDGQTVMEGLLPPGAMLGVATHRFEISYVASAIPPAPSLRLSIHDPVLRDGNDASQSIDDIDDIEFIEFIDDDEELCTDNGETQMPNAVEELETIDSVNDSADHWDFNKMLTDEASALHDSDEAVSPIKGLQTEMEELFPPIVGRSIESRYEVASTDKSPTSVAPTPIESSSVSNSAHETQTPVKQSSPATITQEPLTKPTSSEVKPQIESRSEADKPITDAVQRVPTSKAEDRSVADGLEFSSEQWLKLVRQKYERVQQFLKDHQFSGLILTRPANIAWATCGADVPRRFDGQPVAALLMTPDSRILLGRKVDCDLLPPSAISEMGFEFHDCDWPHGSSELWQGRDERKSLACDQQIDAYMNASTDVSAMRLPLSPQDVIWLRKLGYRVAYAVESAAREFRRGSTEAQIASDVAARLIRHEVVPERIQVWGDGRAHHWRNWNYGREPVERECTISVVARRHGLHVAVSRTVSFGTPSKELRWTFADMSTAHAAAMTYLQNQSELSTVWSQVEQTYDKLGDATHWRETEPGCVTGYELCEAPISASSRFRLAPGMPVICRSVIGSARAVDTVLVRESNNKVVTQTGEWPQSSFALDFDNHFAPAVLQRKA